MNNITMNLKNKKELKKIMINMSEDLFFKEIDSGKYICLPKYTKTIVKLYFTHNKRLSETFVINYAENFSKRHLEDFEEYQNALFRLAKKCDCRNLKYAMVQAAVTICSYTDDGDFFLQDKFYALNSYSTESLTERRGYLVE